ncbi:hypothetical protein AB4403_16790 [Vibrio breoganii]
MAKSPFAKRAKGIRASRHHSNVVSLELTIPVKYTNKSSFHELDITHLAHHCCDRNNEQISTRIPYIRQFVKKTREYVDNGKSAKSVEMYYSNFQSYIRFCDYNRVDPFSVQGYLNYFSNDGELRHRIKVYNSSLRLWQRSHGDEIGIKEATATGYLSSIVKTLTWCGLDAQSWKHLHRPFNSRNEPYKAYSESEEKIIVSRLSDLFFGLASQLIAIKNYNTPKPDELPISIDFGGWEEKLFFSTSLNTQSGKTLVNASSAFNIAMGAAYHLFCYFTSLNDGQVRSVCHPLTIETDARDRSLKMIKIKGFKARANHEVSALVTNEVNNNDIVFEVEKKSGVAFIEVLSELSTLYGSNQELLYTLDNNEQISSQFNLSAINLHLTKELNLLSSHRALNLPWFRELFYTFNQGNTIKLKLEKNEMDRFVVSKAILPRRKPRVVRNILNISYCILTCFTEKPLKGILLPLSYSKKDINGNIRVSFNYQNGEQGYFDVPASDLSLVQDIEKWAIVRANNQRKTQARYLFKIGNSDYSRQWQGVSPISSQFTTNMSIEPNDYFLTLQSSRFRETTSTQEYRAGHFSHLKHLLQNTLATLDKHYSNGHPETNKQVLAQAVQVLERIATGNSIEEAKEQTMQSLRIEILAYDKSLKDQVKTNPNGIACNGKQVLKSGKNTQRATNKTMQQDLPCSEFDMCHKCTSAKAVDEPNAIYKLMSFIDVLREAQDRHPDAKQEVQDKIDAFEYTLESASPDVLEEAMALFNKNGRHPRITMSHALLAIGR